MPDRYFCLPLFLHCLPFGGDRKALKETHRYRTWATRHVAPLLPVLGDWKGTGAPVLTLFSRNGQAMGLDLFQSRSNYNCVIAAASGKGKSFLANQLIESYLETGGRVWVIDVGRSYQKLARVLHGEFLEFKNDGSLRINPFELVRDYSEEEDMLVGLLSAMIAPTRPLADLQTAELKRLLKQAWDSQGHDLTLDDMAAALPIAFAPTVRTDGSIPIRTPPRVMRILVGSWEDQRNTLHLAGYVFTEITPRQWQVGLPAPPGPATLRPLQTVAAPPETKESLAQAGRHRRTPRSLVEQALGSTADTLQGAREALQSSHGK